MSVIDNFPYRTSILARFRWCSLWSISITLGSTQRRITLIIRAVIANEFQRVLSQSTNVTDTDTRTDGQLTVTIPHYTNCMLNYSYRLIHLQHPLFILTVW